MKINFWLNGAKKGSGNQSRHHASGVSSEALAATV